MKLKAFRQQYTHKGLVKRQADGSVEIIQTTLQFTCDGPLIHDVHVTKTEEHWWGYLIIWVRDKSRDIYNIPTHSMRTKQMLYKKVHQDWEYFLFNPFVTDLIVWQAQSVGKINEILCSEWLPVQARWSYLAHLGLPTVSCKKKSSKAL